MNRNEISAKHINAGVTEATQQKDLKAQKCTVKYGGYIWVVTLHICWLRKRIRPTSRRAHATHGAMLGDSAEKEKSSFLFQKKFNNLLLY